MRSRGLFWRSLKDTADMRKSPASTTIEMTPHAILNNLERRATVEISTSLRCWLFTERIPDKTWCMGWMIQVKEKEIFRKFASPCLKLITLKKYYWQASCAMFQGTVWTCGFTVVVTSANWILLPPVADFQLYCNHKQKREEQLFLTWLLDMSTQG